MTRFPKSSSPGSSNLNRKRSERFLFLCYFDPNGIATVRDGIDFIQRRSCFTLDPLNFFGSPLPCRIPERLRLDDYAGIIIHNALAYNVENLESLDADLKRGLDAYEGLKVLMKQDENFRPDRLVDFIASRELDLVLTCLDEAERPKVYPPSKVGGVRFMQMLTGYVTPAMRAFRFPQAGDRPIDIGYRGSIQPLAFGRRAYEKRQIGEAVTPLARRRGLRIDISSRWEDRFPGDAWIRFLASCKATLGVETAASIFDLDGSVERRYHAIVDREGEHLEDASWCERVLVEFSALEDNVRYGQISPRHLEAAATRTVQILYEGEYSGILQAHRHFWPLRRDLSNFDDIVERLADPGARALVTEQAFEEVICNRAHWFETFVERLDREMEQLLPARRRPAFGGWRRSWTRKKPAQAFAAPRLSPVAGGVPVPGAGTIAHRIAKRLWLLLPVDLRRRIRSRF